MNPAAAPPLADRIRDRDPRAIARAVSIIENEQPEAAALVARLYPHAGRAYVIGITGAPGAGKSTLVEKLIGEYRRMDRLVGVLAVDPTSPYTGGAILGDRVRMQAHAQDAGVFIRSMATRGHLGGLARTTAEAAIVLDAAGFDIVIIETVGVGQAEIDVVRTADVSVVTVVPGTGDDVQALKAGIMEIADIFVVNKADREGADRTAASIETMLALEDWGAGEWRPPVLRTEATTGRGVRELVDTIAAFREHSGGSLQARRHARAEWLVRETIDRAFLAHLERDVLAPGELAELIERVERRDIDPYAAADQVLARALAGARAAGNAEAGEALGLRGVDHVGIATAQADDLQALFARLFEVTTDAPEVVGQHRVRFVDTGDTTLELVEPMVPDAPVARFLERRGAGLHHVCLRVRDIERALAVLRARGVRLIDERPRPGAHGSRIAFIHPDSVGGLLIELKQP